MLVPREKKECQCNLSKLSSFKEVCCIDVDEEGVGTESLLPFSFGLLKDDAVVGYMAV